MLQSTLDALAVGVDSPWDLQSPHHNLGDLNNLSVAAKKIYCRAIKRGGGLKGLP